MIGYNADLAPEPFGLSNTGVICYFNAFLQSLSSCTAFIETVLKNEELLSTNTGKAVYSFIKDVNRSAPVSHHSNQILTALKSDLRRRRPNLRG
jgi:ubiquitin C-terminal hydrolase